MKNAMVAKSYDEYEKIGKAMVASGYFGDVRQISQAVVKVMAGAELGLPPFASMAGVHIIQGKPALGANLIATLIKNDPRYDYRVVEHTEAVCRIEFYEDGEKVGVSEFTAWDARKAGTKNMGKYPKNMLFARAISNGAKWYTPGVFGGAPVYTPDELGAEVDEDGDIIAGSFADTTNDEAEEAPASTRQQAEEFAAENGGIVRQTPPSANEADARAWLEGLQTISYGNIATAAAQSTQYKNEHHAFQALLKHEELAPYAGKISMATAVKDRKNALGFYDWLMTRKAAQQAALIEGGAGNYAPA